MIDSLVSVLYLTVSILLLSLAVILIIAKTSKSLQEFKNWVEKSLISVLIHRIFIGFIILSIVLVLIWVIKR